MEEGLAQSTCHSTGIVRTPSLFYICAGLLPGATLGTPLLSLGLSVSVFRFLVAFSRGLGRGAQGGLFAELFPGPSHQCAVAEHPTFPWLDVLLPQKTHG